MQLPGIHLHLCGAGFRVRPAALEGKLIMKSSAFPRGEAGVNRGHTLALSRCRRRPRSAARRAPVSARPGGEGSLRGAAAETLLLPFFLTFTFHLCSFQKKSLKMSQTSAEATLKKNLSLSFFEKVSRCAFQKWPPVLAFSEKVRIGKKKVRRSATEVSPPRLKRTPLWKSLQPSFRLPGSLKSFSSV